MSRYTVGRKAVFQDRETQAEIIGIVTKIEDDNENLMITINSQSHRKPLKISVPKIEMWCYFICDTCEEQSEGPHSMTKCLDCGGELK